jgi:hypothetical protein
MNQFKYIYFLMNNIYKISLNINKGQKYVPNNIKLTNTTHFQFCNWLLQLHNN